LPKKNVKSEKTVDTRENEFSFRVRVGEHEIEIRGKQQDVLSTIDKLPKLMKNVSEAFKTIQVKASVVNVSTTTSEQKAKMRGIPLPYPKISKAESCSKAILKLLESDWGRWRPRTLKEILEALEANRIHYPPSTISSVLNRLAHKGSIRRWKTDEGYVYILADKEEDKWEK